MKNLAHLPQSNLSILTGHRESCFTNRTNRMLSSSLLVQMSVCRRAVSSQMFAGWWEMCSLQLRVNSCSCFPEWKVVVVVVVYCNHLLFFHCLLISWRWQDAHEVKKIYFSSIFKKVVLLYWCVRHDMWVGSWCLMEMVCSDWSDWG